MSIPFDNMFYVIIAGYKNDDPWLIPSLLYLHCPYFLFNLPRDIIQDYCLHLILFPSSLMSYLLSEFYPHSSANDDQQLEGFYFLGSLHSNKVQYPPPPKCLSLLNLHLVWEREHLWLTVKVRSYVENHLSKFKPRLELQDSYSKLIFGRPGMDPPPLKNE